MTDNQHHNPGRILAVDDDQSIRLLLDKYLGNAGYSVRISKDAAETMQALSEEPFDVVVMDILLPDLQGTELLKKIRNDHPGVRVILITGKPSFETAAIALRLGAFDYITKPFNRSTLLNPIKKAVEVKKLDDENRRLQDENRKHREHLEEKVQERTKEVEHITNRLLAVQEEERSHLSRELHDDLGQGLLALKLSLQSAFGKLSAVSPELIEEFNHSLDYLDRIIDRSRKLTRSLSPIHLERLGLIRAVHDMAEVFIRDGKMEIQIDLQELEGFFPGNWNINLYRLIQETLTNAIKHANATKIQIQAKRNQDTRGLTIFVSDNGRGFDPNLSSEGIEGGLGLKIMKKRVDLLSGTIYFKTSLDNGTEVRIELPETKI